MFKTKKNRNLGRQEMLTETGGWRWEMEDGGDAYILLSEAHRPYQQHLLQNNPKSTQQRPRLAASKRGSQGSLVAYISRYHFRSVEFAFVLLFV